MAKTLEEKIEHLEHLIDQGAKETEFEGGGTRRRAEYQSMDQMRSRLASLKAQQQPRPRRSLVVVTTKGYRR